MGVFFISFLFLSLLCVCVCVGGGGGIIFYTALQKFGITLAGWSTRGNTAAQMTIFFKNITQNIFKFRLINARYMITTRPWSYLQNISIFDLI